MRLHLPTSLLLLTFSTLLVTVAESFIIGGPKEIVTPNPDLLRFTEAQTGTLLNIRMDVAEAGLEAETRMGINGMTFELSDEAVEATKHLRKFLEPQGMYNYDGRGTLEAMFDTAKRCHYVETVSGTQYFASLNKEK